MGLLALRKWEGRGRRGEIFDTFLVDKKGKSKPRGLLRCNVVNRELYIRSETRRF